MSKNFEVELRGPISRQKITELTKLFRKEGKFKSRKDRILIDFFDFDKPKTLETRKKDIRVRTTNGMPEIVLKLGGWGRREHREELRVTLHEGQFDTLVNIFGHLGFDKGIFAVRRAEIYEYKGVEFSLSEVPNHSYFFEAEKMVKNAAAAEKAKQEIEQICAALGLKLFNDKTFIAYLKKLNRESNEKYHFSKYKQGSFKRRFGV